MTDTNENLNAALDAEVERMLAAMAAADPPSAPPALLAALAADAVAVANQRRGARGPLLPRGVWAAAMAAGVAGMLLGASGALDMALDLATTTTAAATVGDLDGIDLLSGDLLSGDLSDASAFVVALFGEEG